MPTVNDLFRKEVERLGGVKAVAAVLKCSTEYVYMVMSGSRRLSSDRQAVMERESEGRLPASKWARPLRRRKSAVAL